MMLRRRIDLSTSVILAAMLCCVSCQNVPSTLEMKTGLNESRPRVFSPRMDYDEWTPLGRGDPLKNDPTFDYVPPVLDRVQYWLDSHTTERSTKRDILILGVTAKKTSPKIPEQFLKFVDGPKFNRNPEQYRSEPVVHINDYTGSSGAEPPKVVRTTNFRNGIIDYRNQNRIHNIPASYYPSPFYNQKPKPYTMMLPPPVVPKPVDASQPAYNPQNNKVSFPEQNQQFSTQTEEGPLQTDHQIYNSPPKSSYSQPHPLPRLPQSSSRPPPSKNVVSQIETIKSVYTPPAQHIRQRFETTTPSVSFEKSNLIYHSSQTVSGGWLANNGPSSNINQVTWQPPADVRDHYEALDHHVAASSSHEVIIGQNANIIVDGDSNENEEVVIGQKGSESPDTVVAPVNVVQSSMISFDDGNPGDIVVGQPAPSKMHIVMANSEALDSAGQAISSKGPVAVVMPTNYMEKLNVTIGDLRDNETVGDVDKGDMNATQEDNPNIITSDAEQSIQLSNPIPTQNAITNPPPLRNEDLHQPTQMFTQMKPHNPGFNMPIPQPLTQQAPDHIVQHMNPTQVMMPYMPSGHQNVGPPMGYRHTMEMGQLSPQMVHMQQNHMSHKPYQTIVPSINMDFEQHKPPQPIYNQNQMMFTKSPLQIPVTAMRENHEEMTSKIKHVSNAEMLMPFLPTLPTPVTKPETTVVHQTAPPNLELVTNYIQNQSPLAKILNNELKKVSQPLPTTTSPSLTTDPLFSHYKQPAKPIRGPMYLIIQGHSKVKTYRPSVNRHGVPVENNEIQENTTEQLSKLEQLINENTKSRHIEKDVEKKMDSRSRERTVAIENLLSLVDSNFSGFTVPTPPAMDERLSNSVTTIEINNN